MTNQISLLSPKMRTGLDKVHQISFEVVPGE